MPWVDIFWNFSSSLWLYFSNFYYFLTTNFKCHFDTRAYLSNSMLISSILLFNFFSSGPDHLQVFLQTIVPETELSQTLLLPYNTNDFADFNAIYIHYGYLNKWRNILLCYFIDFRLYCNHFYSIRFHSLKLLFM